MGLIGGKMKKVINCLIILLALILLLPSCGNSRSGTQGAHKHSFGTWETQTAASCTEPGVIERVCTECGETASHTLAPIGHVLGNWTENRVFEYTKSCTLCGEAIASFEVDDVASEGLELERGPRDNFYTVTGIGNCKDSVVVIPRELNGIPVTEIKRYAFADCKDIDAVSIPDTVTVIQSHAFAGSSIKRIFIPDSVTQIGDSAFAECRKLTELILPNSLTSVGSRFVSGTSSLSEIIIPQSLTRIGNDSFANSGIRALSLHSGITQIGDSAFKNCNRLESVSLPDTLTEIAAEAFAECMSLVNIYLPDSIAFIGAEAFSGCTSLVTVNIPKGIASLPTHVFENCTSLGKVYLNEELKQIDGTAFLGVNAESLEFVIPKGNNIFYTVGSSLIGRDPSSVTLGSLLIKKSPDAVIIGSADGSIPTDSKIKKIGGCAFQGRNDLTEIVISKNITSIGGGAFYDCPNLKSIRYEGTVAEWEKVSLGVKWYMGSVKTVKCSDGEAKIGQ